MSGNIQDGKAVRHNQPSQSDVTISRQNQLSQPAVTTRRHNQPSQPDVKTIRHQPESQLAVTTSCHNQPSQPGVTTSRHNQLSQPAVTTVHCISSTQDLESIPLIRAVRSDYVRVANYLEMLTFKRGPIELGARMLIRVHQFPGPKIAALIRPPRIVVLPVRGGGKLVHPSNSTDQETFMTDR